MRGEVRVPRVQTAEVAGSRRSRTQQPTAVVRELPLRSSHSAATGRAGEWTRGAPEFFSGVLVPVPPPLHGWTCPRRLLCALAEDQVVSAPLAARAADAAGAPPAHSGRIALSGPRARVIFTSSSVAMTTARPWSGAKRLAHFTALFGSSCPSSRPPRRCFGRSRGRG